MKKIEQMNHEVTYHSRKVRELIYEDWLRTIERQRELLVVEEKRLKWVKQQLSAILAKCVASLMKLSTSRRQMKKRSEIEAKRVYIALMNTDERSTRSIRSMSDIQKHEHTNEHLRVLCHWENECSQFEKESRKWKIFLNYQQKKETDEKTKIQTNERQSAESSIQVNLWKDYQAYELLKVDNAKQWVEFWQRQMRYFEKRENNCVRKVTASRCHSWVEDMQKHVEEARKQVEPAETRLEWVKQQVSVLLAECTVSTMKTSTSDHLQNQVMPRKKATRSGQITLKNLRFDRSSRSILRSKIYTLISSDHRERKLKASSTLDSIRSAVFKKSSIKSRKVRSSKQNTQQFQSQSAEYTIVASNSNARERRRSKRSLTLQAKTSWRDEKNPSLIAWPRLPH